MTIEIHFQAIYTITNKRPFITRDKLNQTIPYYLNFVLFPFFFLTKALTHVVFVFSIKIYLHNNFDMYSQNICYTFCLFCSNCCLPPNSYNNSRFFFGVMASKMCILTPLYYKVWCSNTKSGYVTHTDTKSISNI